MRTAQTDEIAFDARLARALILEQFPQFAGREIEAIGRGMDNAVFRAGDVVFRFPLRTLADEIMAAETAVVPALAPHLPLPVSYARLRGVPAERYPFHFAGFAFVEGVPIPEAAVDDDDRAALARPLAEFLRALHGLDPVALGIAGRLPGDDLRRFDHLRRCPLARERLAALRAHVSEDEAETLLAFMERVAPVNLEGESCIVHGDLYAQHILVDARRRMSGIIDWGDVHYGNPAVDLAAAFYVLPVDALTQFFTLYGGAGERTIALAAYRAAYHGALVATADWAEPPFIHAGLRAVHTVGAFVRATSVSS